MAKEYKVGEKYYLPVTVERIVEGEFGVTLSFADGDEGDTALIWNAPDLLLTANEIAENIAGRRCAECLIMYDEVKARNAELEALLKEVTATRDEAIKQNNELIAENKKLKAGADKLKDTLVDRTKDVQHYKEENDRLKKSLEERAENVINLLEENDKLKAGLDVRYNDVLAMKKGRDTLLAENEKLKAERDDLASQLGKNLAEIQNLSSEVHFLKAQKEVKKPVHVFTNDGTEVEFRRYTSVQYRTDYNILVIKDGEEIVAGFIRGDRPGNLAYWWTE